ERPTDVRHDDPHPALGQAEHLGQGLAHGERVLRSRPHRQLAALMVGDRAQGLEWKVMDGGQREGVVEHEIGSGKRRGGISAAKSEVMTDIARDVGLDVLDVGKERGARPIHVELGAPGASASSMLRITGSGAYSTETRRSASSAVSASTA